MVARLVALSMVITVPAVAAEPAPAPRQPTGKWLVDYAENMCVLQREYGSLDDRLTLAFKPTPVADWITAYVLDRPARRKGEWVPVTIGFGAGLPTVDARMATFDVREEKFRFNETGLKRIELERAVASEQISFSAKDWLSVSFRVPEFKKALKALDACVVDLLHTWGFSRERQAAMAKPPEPFKPLAAYVANGDYPDEAIRDGKSGSNSARFRINTEGHTSGCMIVESSGSDALDKTLCRVTKRFRFHPAVDKNGQPMETIGFYRLRWILPSY